MTSVVTSASAATADVDDCSTVVATVVVVVATVVLVVTESAGVDVNPSPSLQEIRSPAVIVAPTTSAVRVTPAP